MTDRVKAFIANLPPSDAALAPWETSLADCNKAHPPEEVWAEARRTAATTDMQMPDPETGEMRAFTDLLDAADQAEAEAVAMAAVLRAATEQAGA